jgi:Vitamin B12 dependent methionine synthase, activation domain
MRRVIRLSAREVRPDAADVLRHQGIPPGAAVSLRLRALVRDARAAFDALVSPVGVFDDVSASEFAAIYAGAGHNEPGTPMQEILPRAEALALFAATIGPGIETEIRRRLSAWDAAFACTLDAFASAATERLADLVAREYLATAGRHLRGPAPTHVVPYSPGYCGWHVSGQASLFDRLRPAEIGIELNDRCFMVPAKSVSGVLVAGPSEAHRFRPVYTFCDVCATHECHERFRALRESN